MTIGNCVLSAQTVYNPEPLYDFQLKAAVGASHKFFNLMTLSAEQEGRMRDHMSSCRSYSTVDINFDLFDFFKAGFGYTFIYQTPHARHRGYVDVMGVWKTGNWTFSLKERVQMTHKVWDINNYQQPRNLVELKSRVKASYKFASLPLKPYASFEVRNEFNGVRYASYSTFRPESLTYNDSYINRLRTTIGTEWRLNRTEILDFYLMYDYNYDRQFDVSRNKQRFRSITNQYSHIFSFGVSLWFKI